MFGGDGGGTSSRYKAVLTIYIGQTRENVLYENIPLKIEQFYHTAET